MPRPFFLVIIAVFFTCFLEASDISYFKKILSQLNDNDYEKQSKYFLYYITRPSKDNHYRELKNTELATEKYDGIDNKDSTIMIDFLKKRIINASLILDNTSNPNFTRYNKAFDEEYQNFSRIFDLNDSKYFLYFPNRVNNSFTMNLNAILKRKAEHCNIKKPEIPNLILYHDFFYTTGTFASHILRRIFK